MGTRNLATLFGVALLALTGCHGSGSPKESLTAPTSAPSNAASSPRAEQDLATLIHAEPREGGVREYLAQEGGQEYSDISGDWKSYLSLTGDISIDWAETERVTFIPVCDTASGTFVLYTKNKNIGEGSCGPRQIPFFTPPRLNNNEKQEFSFKITEATKAEVAVYVQKKT